MQLLRVVEPELLDQLAARDPGAIRSRQDLRRLNFLMGHAGMLARLLRANGALDGIGNLIELGGGDGTFLLALARKLAPHCGPMTAVLVDRQSLVSTGTQTALEKFGWKLEVEKAEVIEWLAQRPPLPGTATIANLFLHHFEGEQLKILLSEAALKTELFAACEPRRSGLALKASRLSGLIGCNSVTRHDAVASVRAGFSGRELSVFWPASSGWRLDEGESGLFSHYFVARRRS